MLQINIQKWISHLSTFSTTAFWIVERKSQVIFHTFIKGFSLAYISMQSACCVEIFRSYCVRKTTTTQLRYAGCTSQILFHMRILGLGKPEVCLNLCNSEMWDEGMRLSWERFKIRSHCWSHINMKWSCVNGASCALENNAYWFFSVLNKCNYG